MFSILQFHVGGNVNPFVSIFTANQAYATLTDFPFQSLGFIALIILLLMAATSHDFWLKNLSPRVWKSLHMMVYVAYFLIIMHIVLGVIQLENNPTFVIIIGVGAVGLVVLHLSAGVKALKKDGETITKHENWVLVGALDDIDDSRAKVVNVGTETIAVFKYDGKLSAISNVCKHQNGPLGEGKIIDGCITCPWHGYQYRPDDGCSPPPFTEKVSTYELKIENQQVYVDPAPKAEGTRIEPITF
ncbi:MAG: Rieske 2Fe-2S domain-containing protein [Bacteroidota bacterium]